MSTIDTRRDQMFPAFDADQIATARRFASGPAIAFAPDAPMYEVGEMHATVWLVIEGGISVVRRDGLGHERHITMHQTGQFTGEVSQLAGRGSLAAGKAGPDGCTALPFDTAHLRALIIGAAELGEIIMRAFILRRVALIENDASGSILVGRPGETVLTRLQAFLTRNGYPNTVLNAADDAEGIALVERLGILPEDLPLMVCPNGTILKRPTEIEAAACLGITPELDPDKTYDVTIVGAGPAGLATAVYAASEGLSVLILDQGSFGGQAGASARIENYLGFPTGISGQALAGRAYTQALKFGTELALPLEVSKLDCADREPGRPLRLVLSNGVTVSSHTVVIASGARYRRPPIDNLARFEGAGVSYWASPIEARMCAGEEVALIGGGNSAGQAVVFLSPRVRKLHLMVRREGLEATMSKYLIDRIAALPNVELHTHTEVIALDGDDTGLAGATFRHRLSGETHQCDMRHLFLFIGADPNTRWLDGCVSLDGAGFVRTGESGGPRSLETDREGVFAIGDVRCGSVKRVAAAVGEGAAVVAQAHQYLASVEAAP